MKPAGPPTADQWAGWKTSLQKSSVSQPPQLRECAHPTSQQMYSKWFYLENNQSWADWEASFQKSSAY